LAQPLVYQYTGYVSYQLVQVHIIPMPLTDMFCSHY